MRLLGRTIGAVLHFEILNVAVLSEFTNGASVFRVFEHSLSKHPFWCLTYIFSRVLEFRDSEGTCYFWFLHRILCKLNNMCYNILLLSPEIITAQEITWIKSCEYAFTYGLQFNSWEIIQRQKWGVTRAVFHLLSKQNKTVPPEKVLR